MLSRLKSASPKVKFFLGLWLAVEVLSIPAAAAFAWAFGLPVTSPAMDRELVAERLQTNVPGVSHFVVTHSDAFDIAFSGVTDKVHVTVEDAYQRTPTVSGCAQIAGPSPHTIKTVSAPAHKDKPIGTLFVTVTHDSEREPDIRFESKAEFPEAPPCHLS